MRTRLPDVAPTPSNAPIFGSFTLLAKLARGDIGDLFLARSLGAGGFEKLVVIKRIHPDFTRDPEIAQLFLEEARTAARIEHPNIRIVYEIGSNEEHYYIALEYLEGVPLVDVLLGRRRDPRLADSRLFVGLLAQACQGIHAAHTLQAPGGGLVHGDINPRSIFVTATGTTKILDFDIVEMRGALATRHGFMRRTNAYLSPEEVSTGVCDQLGDIFSLGVVAWECLTGRRLFKQKSRDETLAAISHGLVPSAQSLRPEISDELNATVMRALSRDPSFRFQTASEFGTALERAALAEGPPLTPVNIAALLQNSFAKEFSLQKSFVRTARQGRGPELTAQHEISEEVSEHAAETRVASDPGALLDDWGTQNEAATRVVEYDDHLNIAEQANAARNKNPFDDVSGSADYSLEENTPGFQDTQNLVLAELGIEDDDYDDDGEPAAVQLEQTTPAYQTPSPQKQQQQYQTSPPQQQYHTQQQQQYHTPPPQQQYHTPPPQQQYQTPPPQQEYAAPPAQQPYQTPPPQQHYSTPPPQGPSTPAPSAYTTPLPPAYTTTGPQQPVFQTPPPPDAYPSLPSQGSYGDHSNLPRMPSTLDPTLQRGPSTVDPSDERLSTIEPPSQVGKGARKAKKARAAAKRGKKKSKKPIVFLLLLFTAAAAAAAYLYVTKYSKKSKSAQTEEPRDIQNGVAIPKDTTPSEPDNGAAASILKAANQNGEPGQDAGPTATTEMDAAIFDAAPSAAALADIEIDADIKTDTAADAPVDAGSVAATKPTPRDRRPKDRTNKKPEPKKAPGFLTVSSTPYATVFVDGKKKGFTPVVKLKLAPGPHRLKLVSSVDGTQKKMTVRIVSGGEIRRLVKF